MGQILFGGGVTNRIGCMDSLAINYDPAATIPCSSDFTINPTVCCIYGTNIVGCMDPFAINYNPNASTNCTTCCVYDSGPFTDVLDFGDFGDFWISFHIFRPVLSVLLSINVYHNPFCCG